MDPIGKQKRIKSDQYHEGFEKLLDKGGAKSKYEGDRNMRSGTHPAREGKLESKWQGTVKGKTTHTYKKDGDK